MTIEPALNEEVETARQHFIAWMEWYMQGFPADAPSKDAFAKKLGVSRATVSLLLNPNLSRAPDFKTLVAVSRLLRVDYGALLTRLPPPLPKERT